QRAFPNQLFTRIVGLAALQMLVSYKRLKLPGYLHGWEGPFNPYVLHIKGETHFVRPAHFMVEANNCVWFAPDAFFCFVLDGNLESSAVNAVHRFPIHRDDPRMLRFHIFETVAIRIPLAGPCGQETYDFRLQHLRNLNDMLNFSVVSVREC